MTLAQMPPACGDRWRLSVMLQRGKYVLTVAAGSGKFQMGLMIANV